MIEPLNILATVPSGPPVPHLAIMVTRRCNMTCAHCSVESHPAIRRQPDEQQLLRSVREAAAAGVQSILFTGGEPMLRERVVLRLMKECQKLGVATALATNGFWGKTLEGARRRLRTLRRAGLNRLNVSYDRYHADFQGAEPILNIARAADEINFSFNIAVTRVADDPELEQIVAPFRELRRVRLRFYDVQAVGSARNLPPDSLRAETEGFCSACSSPAITDDGRMTACNGPSYFAKAPSPLHVGSLDQTSFDALASRHRADPILDTIRTFGPSRLRDKLKTIPGFEDFPFRQQYQGICELCHQITSHPAAVEALRKKLAEPAAVAERVAMQRVMAENKRSGLLNRDYANGVGACRAFLRAVSTTGDRWTAESRKVLGRADIDWNHLSDYLIACGMARLVLPVLEDAELRRWAPRFFAERIRQVAISEGLKELVLRDALQRISDVCGQLKTEGVLLKGAALLALSGPPDRAAQKLPARSAGDIDVYVPPRFAAKVRAQLLKVGCADTGKTIDLEHHHLAPVSYRGISIEIHTRIMPAFLGAPESDMLAHTRGVPDRGFEHLRTLSPEGVILHCAVHTAVHQFSGGFKAAWDLWWILASGEDIDWEQLHSWVDVTRVRRAFWGVLCVLASELELPVPFEFLRRAPRDRQQRKIELIARRRLFHAFDRTRELNPFSRYGVLLLLHNSRWDRLVFMAGILGKHLQRLRTIGRPSELISFTGIPGLLRGAISDWLRFRKASAGDAQSAE